MDELQKNVKHLVAKKVLKDIHEIVQAENKKEKSEWYWAKATAVFLAFILLALILLKYL